MSDAILQVDYWFTFRLTTDLCYAINEKGFKGRGIRDGFEPLLNLLLELGFDLVWDVDIQEDWWDEDEFYYFIRQFASLAEFIAIARKIPHSLILELGESDYHHRLQFDFEIYDEYRE